MRQEFIEAETRHQAQERAPWACIIVDGEDGFLAFESVDDYKIWVTQPRLH